MRSCKQFSIFTHPSGPLSFAFSKLGLTCLIAIVLFISLSFPLRGDTITSTVIADVGPSPLEVEDSQTNTFLPLSASQTRNTSGFITNSNVSATFTSEDQFQLSISNNWDARGATAPSTIAFGTHFEYEFVADGTSLMVSTSNFVEAPLFSGASTLGAGTLLWRLLDLTIPNGFVVMTFAGNGSQSLVMTDGHSYLLELRDQSSVSAGPGSLNLGLLHTMSFDVSVDALFNTGDFDVDSDVDGVDFLKWQRGETDDPLSPVELANWEDTYGLTPAALSASVGAVPEPSIGALMLGGLVVLFPRRLLG